MDRTGYRSPGAPRRRVAGSRPVRARTTDSRVRPGREQAPADLYGPSEVKVYTKAGDDGTTGLFYGGRVRKDSELPTAYGSVDEAQAVIGLARAHAGGRARRDAGRPCCATSGC